MQTKFKYTMENSEKFDEASALKVISEMIEATKNDVRSNSFFYLLWGFLVLTASLLEYCLLQFFKTPHHYIGWPVLMGIGALVSIAYSIRKYGKTKASTYIGNFFTCFFIGWTISLLILLFFVISGNYKLIQPVSLAMYGLATFVSGGILRFRPLIWGGVIAWVAAMGSYFAPFPVQLLITAATVVVAYLVPGFYLKQRRG
jgi:hypothetical protein